MRWRTLILFVLLLIPLTSLRVMAQTTDSADPDEISGLDLLFIIDQSASMGADDDDNVENDELDLRFFAPLYATEWLGDLNLSRSDGDSYRVAVVNFGTNARAKVFPMAGGTGHWLELDPTSEAAWATLRGELANEFDPAAFGDHLGFTWPLRAFETADVLFDELPEDPTRRRAIIVLTDGLPNRGDGSGASVGPLNQVADYVQANFPEPEYIVHAVAMNDASGTFWNASESYWQRITNDRAQIVESNDDVGLLFRDILRDLTGEGSETPPCPEEGSAAIPTGTTFECRTEPGRVIVIPPYLRSISFDYFLSGEGQVPTLEINGVEIDPDTAATVTLEGRGRPIQRIIVRDPEPGRWAVNVTPPDADVDIIMRQEKTTGQLVQPAGERPQQQFTPVDIQYNILDSFGNPLRGYTDPLYEPNVIAFVHVDGRRQQVDLETIDLTTPPNAKTYETQFVPSATGVHTISVRATSQDLNGNTVVIFDGAVDRGFTVDPVQFVALDTPVGGQQFDSYGGSYALTNGADEVITVAYPVDLTVTLTDAGGERIIEHSERNGVYSYEFAADVAGEQRVHALATITDEEGVVHTLLDEETVRFDVAPTLRLSLRLLDPSEDIYEDTDLYFNRQPQMIRFQVVNDDGQPVDVNDALTDPDDAVTFEIVNADGESVSELFNLRQVGNSGIYQAETEALGRGKYTVSAELDGNPTPSYMLGDTLRVSTEFERIRHPLHIPILIGIIIGLAFLLLLLLAIARWRRSKRVHPATGDIRIVNEFGTTRFRAQLDNYERNRIVFKQTDLANTIHVNKLIVTCDSDQANQSGMVQVQVFLNGDHQPTLERALRRGGEMKLGQHRLWLLKDPSDEQLRDRSIA